MRRPFFTLLAVLLGAVCLPVGAATKEACPPVADASVPRVGLTVRVDPSGLPAEQRSAAVGDTARVLERRLRLYGDPSPMVRVEGQDRIFVEIPGTWGIDDATALLGRPASLEFREEGLTAGDWVVATGRDASGADRSLTGRYIKQAELRFEPDTGRPEILFELDRDGAALLADITARLVRQRLAIVLDDEPLMIVTIQQRISDGRGRIIATLTPREACLIVVQLNAGSLPLRVSVEDVDGLGARAPGAAPLATPRVLARTEAPPIPALTDQQRVQVADIALSDARIQHLVGEHPYRVTNIGVGHATTELRLLGGAAELTFDEPVTLDGEFMATNYDCREALSPPYSPVSYQATIELVERLNVFVDLEAERVVGISPFGGQIVAGPFFPSDLITPTSTCSD